MNPDNVINEILSVVKQKDKKFILNNRFDFSDKSLENWKIKANFAKNILEENNIEYCLFKGYDIPYAIMDDVDILIENNNALRNLLLKLKNKKFVFKHIPFNDELKVSAINKQNDIEIDFYPDAKWGELRYAQKGEISKNRIMDLKHGIKFPIPNPEWEIHIIATHSYYHGRINLLEILNTIKILLKYNPSIKKIIRMAERFHMQNGLLVLLSISKKIMRDYGIEKIKTEDIKILKSISNSRFNKISEKEFSLNEMPLKLSRLDLIFSSIDKFYAKNLDSQAKRSDELAGFMKHNRISNMFYSNFSKKYNEFSSV